MKTLIKILISFTLIYTPFFAFASAAEKWTIEEISYDNVAKNIKIQAEKNYGPSANDNKYKVKVPVTASAAGSTALSMIRMGVAGAALYGLVEGVGWIIENGIVKKPDPNAQTPNNGYAKLWYAGFSIYGIVYSGTTPSHVISLYKPKLEQQQGRTYPIVTSEFVNANAVVYYFSSKDHPYKSQLAVEYKTNPNYDPNLQPKYIPVSSTEMGEKIIDSPSAPQILPSIYNPNNPVSRPSPAPDAADKALENAPPIPKQKPNGDTKPKPNEDTDGDGEPDVFNPEKPSVGTEFTLPEFCSWAVTVCEWYTKYREDSDLSKEHREAEKQVWTQEEIARQEEKQQREDEKSFWQKVEDWFDWSKEDFDLPENEQPEIIDLPIPDLKEDAIKWNSQCPPDVQIPINLQGVSSTITFSWSPWCQLLDVIKPAIIASAYIGAAFIVLGLRT